ncbi:MAG: preprotein translocase subunit SecG [Bdellovibrionaceae bacterium]|nr:preprotein translocase subunit SecG [Pseudobdellovibrionaceae bacterium]|tara:strand:+ start:318 stop:665 length:348 start_codon:yes stop_codon:yes gene_type:complete
MEKLITIVHIVTCVFLVLLVLVQSGKGAEVSASLGGSSQTVFGSSGGANFFTRLTAILAAIFMITSLSLTILGTNSRESVFERVSKPVSASKKSPVKKEAENKSNTKSETTAPTK